MSDDQAVNVELKLPPMRNPAAGLKRENEVGVDVIAVIEQYPQLQEMPSNEAEVIILYASGMLPKTIAENKGMTLQAVMHILKKHDVGVIIRRGLEMQKLLLANTIGSIMVTAVREIKNRSDEMKDMRIPSLVNLMKECVTVIKTLNPPENRESSSVNQDNLLNAIREHSRKDGQDKRA